MHLIAPEGSRIRDTEKVCIKKSMVEVKCWEVPVRVELFKIIDLVMIASWGTLGTKVRGSSLISSRKKGI